MDSSSEHSEKQHTHLHTRHVTASDVDVAAEVAPEMDKPIDPAVARRLKWKIDLHLMPLMCLLYLMVFADKTTLGQSAVLGIIPGAHLNQNQFNWLGTIFYLSFLVFQYPQNLALQRFPVGKWMSINIFIWAVALLSHAACKSFGALFAVRFIMGACEGAITPGFMIVTSMFYTRAEQTRRVGYWFLMNGLAIIFLGFVAFGVLHAKTTKFMPWQWLMAITGIITFITSILFWFFFPDSPTNAKFLTPEERSLAVLRIKGNQSGVENKHWKKDQFIETFRDPKTLVLFLFAAIACVFNSLSNQRQLIINEFGFTPIKTTLIGCVDGVVEILAIWLCVTLASIPRIGRGFGGAVMFIPGILGAILVITLPFHNKIGLLFSYWISIFSITPYPVFLAWVSQVTAGHTKKVTTNAIVMIGYCIGNAAGPFMWKKQYQPRNRIPWIVIASTSLASGILMVILRYMLIFENKKRDNEPHDDTYDDVFLTLEKEDGTMTEKKVDRSFLDLTDKQNRDFRYVF